MSGEEIIEAGQLGATRFAPERLATGVERVETEAELRRVKKECGLLLKEARRLAFEVRELQATKHFLLRQLAKERRRRQRICRSFSWQLTRPLRALASLFQQLAQDTKARCSDRSVVNTPSLETAASEGASDVTFSGVRGGAREASLEQRVAVVVHAFYPELFRELATGVAGAGFAFDLFVTCPDTAMEAIQADLRCAGIRHGVVTAVQNRGRDIAPFLRVLADLDAEGYRLLLKLHTKRSTHRDGGAAWRSGLISPLLATAGADAAITALGQPGGYGIIGPSQHIVSLSKYGSVNLERVRQFAQALGLGYVRTASDAFVAGTMFFARVDALTPLLRLQLDETDFEPEIGQIDGTLAHVIERLFVYSALAAGYRLGSLDEATAQVSDPIPKETAYRFGMSAS